MNSSSSKSSSAVRGPVLEECFFSLGALNRNGLRVVRTGAGELLVRASTSGGQSCLDAMAQLDREEWEAEFGDAPSPGSSPTQGKSIAEVLAMGSGQAA